jgi:hypothetical protein
LQSFHQKCTVLFKLFTQTHPYPVLLPDKKIFIVLYEKLRNKIKKKDVREFLKSKDANTLHFPRRNKYQRNKVILSGIDDTWQIDLADMTNISKDNGTVKYILVFIDVFSKYLSMETTKKKRVRK